MGDSGKVFKSAVKSSLKLKGGPPPKAKTLKASSSSASDRQQMKSGADTAHISIGRSSTGQTAAEKRFEEVQRKRRIQDIIENRHKSHKEKVIEFNERLQKMSEHHDIPKVGPG